MSDMDGIQRFAKKTGLKDWAIRDSMSMLPMSELSHNLGLTSKYPTDFSVDMSKITQILN